MYAPTQLYLNFFLLLDVRHVRLLLVYCIYIYIYIHVHGAFHITFFLEGVRLFFFASLIFFFGGLYSVHSMLCHVCGFLSLSVLAMVVVARVQMGVLNGGYRTLVFFFLGFSLSFRCCCFTLSLCDELLLEGCVCNGASVLARVPLPCTF